MKQKKILLIVLLCLFFLPFIVNAESCNSSNIKLESIELNTTSGNAEEVTEAMVEGKKINLDIKMYNVGDSIEYNLMVKNISNEDFYFDESSLNLNTDYLEYKFIYGDNSNIIEAGKDKTIKLIVEYKNQVPIELINNDSFNDTNSMTVNLSNKDINKVPNTFKNPATGDLLVKYLIVILLSGGILLIAFRDKKITKYMILIVGITIIIPVTVYALCRCDLEIEAKVQILSPVIYPEGKNKATVETGDVVKIGSEEFYVIKHDDNGDLILLARYNLKVGKIIDTTQNPFVITEYTSNDEGYGLQSSEAKGQDYNTRIWRGVFDFSSENYWDGKIGTEYPGSYCSITTYTPGVKCADVFDSNSNLYQHVQSYKEYLNNQGVLIKFARLLELEEMNYLGCNERPCTNAPSWLFETSFWTGTPGDAWGIWDAELENGWTVVMDFDNVELGIRPVIVI